MSIYIDGPENYENPFIFFDEGGSPKLLRILLNEIENNLDNVKEVFISLYLFNNLIFYRYLKKLAKKGIKVNVISIPLEGYSNEKPKTLRSLSTGKDTPYKTTKYLEAKKIYGDCFYSESSNFNLYIFPHIFVRSSRMKKFSRGNLPYSLHSKLFFIKSKNEDCLFLTSSNFAVRDLVKKEMMIKQVCSDGTSFEIDKYFNDLIENSIPIKSYKREFNSSRNDYPKLDLINSKTVFFAAPFYNNSNALMFANIIDLVRKAKDRIYLCAQHISNCESEKYGINLIDEIILKAKQGIKVSLYSQTYIDDNLKNDFRKPINTANFLMAIKKLKGVENVSYFVNSNIHYKFILVDNKMFFCTFNFTSTQFIYVPKVKIDKFDYMPNQSYEGIHSEVGAYMIINNDVMIKSILRTLDSLKSEFKTIQTI